MSRKILFVYAKKIVFALPLFFSLALTTQTFAMGNHPESNTCPSDKPYYVFCSDSMHSLEGWYGACYATREEAERAAAAHVKEQHHGDDRWTGVRKIHPKK
jgi:hypothetical protein